MKNRFVTTIAFVLLCLIWGSSFILMKVSSQGLSFMQIAALRIFSAGLVFIPFSLYFIRFIPRRKLGLVILTGVLGNLVPAFLFALAITRLDSALTGMLNSLTPVFVVLIAWLFWGIRIPAAKIVGVVLGFAGLCLLTFTRSDISTGNLLYSLLVLLATVSYGLNANIVSQYLGDVNPLHGASVSLAVMTIPAALVLWQQDFWSLEFSLPVIQWSIINAVFLGIAASAIATTLFYFLIQQRGRLFASLVTYVIPFVAIGWGIAFGESITAWELVSLGIILLGVYLANRKPPVTSVDDGDALVERGTVL